MKPLANPSRLSDSDLRFLAWVAETRMEACPQFCHWLAQVAEGERVRREQSLPVPKFAFPRNWSAGALAQAIRVLTPLTYAPPSVAAGKFADSLLAAVNGFVTLHLEAVR